MKIFFGAINCWWPEGDCIHYFHLKRFPVFLAHVRNASDIEFKGPLVASYMINFLDNLLEPVIPLNSEGDLLDLRSKHDVNICLI